MLHFSYQINATQTAISWLQSNKMLPRRAFSPVTFKIGNNSEKRTEGSAELWVWLSITSQHFQSHELYISSPQYHPVMSPGIYDSQDQQFYFKLILNSVLLFKCPVWFVSCNYGIRKSNQSFRFSMCWDELNN